MSDQSVDGTVQRGQTWTCNEARADPDDVPAAHDTVDLWPDYPRFSAVVDAVAGDVAELVVGTSNDHPRAPDLGDRVDLHTSKLIKQERWSLKSDIGESDADDPPVVTDGGQCADRTDRCEGQVCPNDDCNIDQRFPGFHGFCCPECACRLVVACSRCDSGAVEEIDGSPVCPNHAQEVAA
ncbi:hypothetical protein NDI56_04075 [Haloarcula sp. S1CR25-12]|uniref:Uncharacterized protein n=1 Tax=Haloarcula saliterrae TaxID=2950534 RepID=A0ABU2F9K2_9EURY|nr:hypothetical protein [Haloarcula sp. S1CR25-12]MDS0258588.1 hypothetical protein [Haloarcula sp. S1CR25-12]